MKAHQGVACFDCHANGHTNASTHTVGDIRPNEHRHRIDTPSLRDVNVQSLFGSQRAVKSVEDFTEFEQRGAYFDGNPADATRQLEMKTAPTIGCSLRRTTCAVPEP